MDFIEDPQDWINGFDAGFANLPLGAGHTQQYCEGYTDGQLLWEDPAESVSSSSVAAEASSLTSLDGDIIDLELSALYPLDDDDPSTPRQPSPAIGFAERQSNIVISKCDELPPRSKAILPHDYVPAFNPSTPRRSTTVLREPCQPARGSERLFDMDFSKFDLSFPVTPSTSQTTSYQAHPLLFETPVRSYGVSYALSAPAAPPLDQTLPLYKQYKHSTLASPCVRRSLNAAKSAQLQADFLAANGEVEAAAAAFSDAKRWEKKARRRQDKNDSQNRIRALKRAKNSARCRSMEVGLVLSCI
jgi:hypothetical protein